MSIATYVRQRRFPNPADYVEQALVQNGEALPRGRIERILQLLNAWDRDYLGYIINPLKRHVRPFWLVPKDPDEQEITLEAAGAAGDRVNMIAFEVDTLGHFEIVESMFKATSPEFLVQIFDGGNNLRGFQNREIHARTVAGDAQRPFIWPESFFVNTQTAARTIYMSFRNLSAQQNKIRWCFHGRRWYHKKAPPEVQRQIEARWMGMEKTYTYFLTLNPVNAGGEPPDLVLAAGAQVQENSAPTFKADSAGDTEVFKVNARIVNADGTDGTIMFALRELQSGKILSNGRVPNEVGLGTGQFSFVLPETFLMERNYEVAFEAQNLNTQQSVKIYPTLIGRRMQYA